MNELLPLLETMSIPPKRKRDIRWLKRNLPIWNSQHPNFFQAMKIIHDLLRQMPS